MAKQKCTSASRRAASRKPHVAARRAREIMTRRAYHAITDSTGNINTRLDLRVFGDDAASPPSLGLNGMEIYCFNVTDARVITGAGLLDIIWRALTKFPMLIFREWMFSSAL